MKEVALRFLNTLASSSEDQMITEVAELLMNLTGATSSEIYLAAADHSLVLRGSTNAPALQNRIRLGKNVGLCGLVYKTNKGLFIDSQSYNHPNFASVSGLDDLLYEGASVLPIRADGKKIGVTLLRKDHAWKLSAAEKRKMQEYVTFAGATISGYHEAWLAGSQGNRLTALSEVSKTLATSPYLEEILQLLVNYTAVQFKYKVCTVRLLDEQRGELVLRATQAPAKAYQRKRAIKMGESIAGRAIAERKPVIVEDVLEEATYIGHDLAKEQGLRSMICVPLFIQDRPVGVMSCYTTEIREFSPDEVSALETLAKQAAISIEHAKLQVRNTLMQEMHHRVKNSLQQIASLLRLQMRHGRYKSLEEALNDSIARILAISSVHDLLSREDLDHVGIRSMSEMLVMHQKSSLMLPDKDISFKVAGKGDDVFLGMQQATQVALVLNELIQNAVEHGYKISDKGEIHVTVEEADGFVKLWVSNQGDLLPADYDPTTTHLGLQIVDTFAKSLGGRFAIKEVFGWTVAELIFTRSTAE